MIQNNVGDIPSSGFKNPNIYTVQDENTKPMLLVRKNSQFNPILTSSINAACTTENKPQSTANGGVIKLLHEIINKQNKIEERITSIEDVLSKNLIETTAQNRLIRECKIITAKVQQSVCRMTGEIVDETMVEISSTLPLTTTDAAVSLEQKLKDQDYAASMISQLHKLKGASDDINAAVRQVFTDELLQQYNWDGRCEKKSLAKLQLVHKFLFDVFNQKGRHQFEQEMKKAVELSHNRLKQKKRLIAKNALKSK